MSKITSRVLEGEGVTNDPKALKSVADNIAGRTVCAFGEACSWPTQSFLAKFPEEFDALAARGEFRVESGTLRVDSALLNRLAQGSDTVAIDGIGNFAVAFDRGPNNNAIGEFEIGGTVRYGYAAANNERNFRTRRTDASHIVQIRSPPGSRAGEDKGIGKAALGSISSRNFDGKISQA